MQLHVQLIEIQARQVAQLDLLQVPPHPFHRVQVRRVSRQRLQVNRATGFRHEVFHLDRVRPRINVANERLSW